MRLRGGTGSRCQWAAQAAAPQDNMSEERACAINGHISTREGQRSRVGRGRGRRSHGGDGGPRTTGVPSSDDDGCSIEKHLFERTRGWNGAARAGVGCGEEASTRNYLQGDADLNRDVQPESSTPSDTRRCNLSNILDSFFSRSSFLALINGQCEKCNDW